MVVESRDQCIGRFAGQRGFASECVSGQVENENQSRLGMFSISQVGSCDFSLNMNRSEGNRGAGISRPE